ncbi:hypothetical protein D9611_002939 [Ephemerocybe angulata]|uniref:Reverse transcriptase domain-containing protein n=1 Tax=Ephemerocybe angulata TaxID=980116 RepID=A0A8H5FHE8_9AGAR|nr:hypothetical protein D9611_002939 [Tulosesus angulatus]
MRRGTAETVVTAVLALLNVEETSLGRPGISLGRIFGRAQVGGPCLPALSVWVDTDTRLPSVLPNGPGMVVTAQSRLASTGSWSSSRTAASSASTGKPASSATASSGAATTYTSARAVDPEATEFRRAVERARINPGSPYRVDEIERLLRRSGLVWRYPDVVEGLRHGFRVGFPTVQHTQVPPNKDSVVEFGPHFRQVVENEIRKGRYLGPVSRAVMESVLGPFQCSPLSVIPKTTPGKYRIIQDFSFPHFFNTLFPQASVNSHTDASAFPCTWGTFMSVAHLVWHLPPGSQMAVRDVSEAYRTIPLHPSQWAATVVGLGQDRFCADVRAAFGARPSALNTVVLIYNLHW